MYTQKTYKIKGVVPMFFHSGRTSNPLDPFAKEIARFTSKKKKTEEDHRAVANLEWLASFYPSEPGEFSIDYRGTLKFSGYGCPVWPGEVIERMLVTAAQKSRLGTTFKSAVMVDGDFPLIYDGPKTIEELFGNPNFRDTRSAKIKMNTVQRTRPIFRDWGLEFTVSYLPELVTEDQIDRAVEIAGVQVGLSDYRPKFGRFQVL